MKIAIGLPILVVIVGLIGVSVSVVADVELTEQCDEVAPDGQNDGENEGGTGWFCTKLPGMKCTKKTGCEGFHSKDGIPCKVVDGEAVGECLKCDTDTVGDICKRGIATDKCSIKDGYGTGFDNWVDCGSETPAKCILDSSATGGAKCADDPQGPSPPAVSRCGKIKICG